MLLAPAFDPWRARPVRAVPNRRTALARRTRGKHTAKTKLVDLNSSAARAETDKRGVPPGSRHCWPRRENKDLERRHGPSSRTIFGVMERWQKGQKKETLRKRITPPTQDKSDSIQDAQANQQEALSVEKKAQPRQWQDEQPYVFSPRAMSSRSARRGTPTGEKIEKRTGLFSSRSTVHREKAGSFWLPS